MGPGVHTLEWIFFRTCLQGLSLTAGYYNYSVFLFSFVAHIGSVYDHSKLKRLIVILSAACNLSCGIKAIDRYSRRILTIK